MYDYEVFQKLLDENGLKVADVCRETGLRQSMMSDWKRGKYSPKADKMQKIADFFGVSADVFTVTKRKPMLIKIPKLPLSAFVDKERIARDIAESLEKNIADLSDGHPEWYLDSEAAREAQEMFEDDDMRALFHMKRNMNPEKFKAHMDMMKQLYRLEHPEDHPEDYE